MTTTTALDAEVRAPLAPLSVHVGPFASLDELRATYRSLVRRYGLVRDDSPPGEFLDDVEAFLARGRATGEVLDAPDDRWDAQSMLNYWATVLFRYRYGGGSDAAPPTTTLVPFGTPGPEPGG